MLLVRVSVPLLGVRVSALLPLIRPVSDADPEACDGSSAKLPLALKVWI